MVAIIVGPQRRNFQAKVLVVAGGLQHILLQRSKFRVKALNGGLQSNTSELGATTSPFDATSFSFGSRSWFQRFSLVDASSVFERLALFLSLDLLSWVSSVRYLS